MAADKNAKKRIASLIARADAREDEFDRLREEHQADYQQGSRSSSVSSGSSAYDVGRLLQDRLDARKNDLALETQYRKLISSGGNMSKRQYRNSLFGWGSDTTDNDSTNVQERKKIYEANQKRIEELSGQISQMQGDHRLQADPSKLNDDLYNLRGEKASLEAENRRYERFQKTSDEYVGLQQNGDFKAYSQRDASVQNPSRHALEIYDAAANAGIRTDENGISRDIYGNEIDPNVGIVQPKVTDKLGMYLDASEDERQNGYGSGTWGEIMAEGVDGNWEELREDEQQTYYYLMNTQGQAAAEKYLKDMEPQLHKRHNDTMVRELQDASVGEILLYNAASVPANIIGGPAGMLQGIKEGLTGDYDPYSGNYQFSNWASAVRGETARRLDDLTGNASLNLGITDLSLGDTYQALMSGADSLIGAKLFGLSYTGAMGAGAASQKMRELYNQGASEEQMWAGGLLSGAAETVFEYVSLDHFLSEIPPSSWKDVIKQTLAQGGVEASEEVFTELSNTITDALVLASESDWRKAVDKYMAMGYSESEAMGKALWNDIAPNVMDAGIGGFISGGAMSGMHGTAVRIADNAELRDYGRKLNEKNGIDVMQNYADQNGMVDELAGQRSAMDDAVEKAKNGGRLAQRAAEKATGQYGKAWNDSIENSSAVDTVRNALGESAQGLTDDQAIALYKQSQGKELTRAEKKAIRSIENSDKLSKSLRDRASDVKNTADLESDMKRSEAVHDYATSEARRRYTDEMDEDIAGIVSDSGKAVMRDSGEEIEIAKKAPVESVAADGTLNLRTESGNIVNSSSIKYADASQALLFETAIDAGYSANEMNQLAAVYDSFSGEIKTSTLAMGVREGYEYGKMNYPMDQISKNGYFSDLPAPMQKLAYDMGVNAAKNQVAQAQEAVNKGRTTAIVNKGEVILEDGITMESLTDRQQASVKAAQAIASSITNNKIHFYQSVRNEAGDFVYASDIGGQKAGSAAGNGFYDPSTGDIYIDVNAGNNGEGVALFTMSHELTHMVAQWSPEKFKTLSDHVFAALGKANGDIESLAQDKMSRAEAAGRSITHDVAMEEVVADSMETMLTDTDLFRKLTELKTKDPTLWDKIKSLISDMLAKIKDLYKDFSPQTREGMLIRQMGKSIESISDLFAEAIVDAGEAYGSTNISDASEVGINIDTKTESANPMTMDSLRSWNESDYVTAKKEAAKEMADALDISEAKALAYIDSINGIARIIAEDRVRLDYDASEGVSSFVGNVEYGGSIDFSTICKKRRLLTGTFSEIQKALPNTALTAEEVLEIRKMMDDKGYEVSCGLCYVEGSRANMGQYARDFLDEYAKTNPEYLPNMAEINTPDGIESIRINHPDVYKAYEKYMNNLAQRKPKLYQMATEYRGEILNKFQKKSANVTEKNRNGGLRLQSFSDFEIIHLIDCMQAITDMSRVGLAGQAYTKVPDFAAALGNTGLKINLSLIAKGIDENGRLVLDEKEGMKRSDAERLRNQYSENVGTIVVIFNDDQLKAAMADDFIDFIIPFHRSQWNKKLYDLMGLPKGAFDYTLQQSESYISPVFNKSGKKMRPKNYMPNAYWDFSRSGKENAEAYLNMCAQNNRKPKFSKLLVNNGDGSYSLQPDGSTDGYWKLLIDFKMYDNDGAGSPQMPVRPDFNMDEAERMLNEYEGGHQQFPVASDIVDEFVSKYKKDHPGTLYSDRDTEYLDLAKDPKKNAERLQQMVDEAARESGYIVGRRYHGTPNDFTVFNSNKLGGHTAHYTALLGNFFTNNKGVADKFKDSNGRVVEAYLKDGKYKDFYSSSTSNSGFGGFGTDSFSLLENDIRDFARENIQKYIDKYHIAEGYVDVLNSKNWENFFVKYPRIERITHNLRNATNQIIKDYVSGLRAEGYIGIKIRNTMVDAWGVESVKLHNAPSMFIAFDSSDIKSADPVTYDDNGNVIPLSERFSRDNADIRYSDRGNGYDGRSMSVNARNAYASGEMPLSRWTKSEIIDAVSVVNDGIDLSSLTKDELIHGFLEKKAWHHTGALYNRTDFYGLKDTVESMTQSDVDSLKGTVQSRIRPKMDSTVIDRSKEMLDSIAVIMNSGVTGLKTPNGLIKRIQNGQSIDDLYQKAREQIKKKDANKVKGWLALPADHYRHHQAELFSTDIDAYMSEVYGNADGRMFPVNGSVYRKVRDILSPSVKMSDRDSTGRELTPQQAEFFKDSKVRDEDGNLLTMYHGTGTKFTTFREGSAEGWGKGIYFTDNESATDEFGNTKVEAYLNITNPFDTRSMSYADIEGDGYNTRAYQKFDREQFKNYFSEDYDSYDEYRSDGLGIDMSDIYEDHIDVFNSILRELGYDGIIGDNTNNIEGLEVVAFRPNQVKSVTNVNPTGADDIRYSERDPNALDSRTLLANALETTVQNEIEAKHLAEYKAKIEQMNAAQAELAETRKQIREMMFTKGKRNMAEYNAIRDKAAKLANRITTYDKQLLKLESMASMKNVIDRERARAVASQKAHAKDVANRQRARRQATDYRHKIAKISDDLRKRITNPTERRFIPTGLVQSVIDVCESIDPTGKKQYSNAAMKYRTGMEALAALKLQYDNISENGNYDFSSEYDADFSKNIALLAQAVGNTPLRDMTGEQLEDVYNIMHDIREMISTATKQIGTDEAISNYEAGQEVIELMDYMREKGITDGKISSFFREWTVNPLRMVNEMSGFRKDSRLVKLFDDINAGRRKADTFTMNVNKTFDTLRESKEDRQNFNSAVEEKRDFGLLDVRGKAVKLTPMQAMSAVLTYEREISNLNRRHLDSPVLFPDAALEAKGKYTQARDAGVRVRIDADAVTKIVDNLTEWEKKYMDTARTFFNKTAQDAVNEVSLLTKHRLVATEKNYFPYTVNDDYVAKESQNLVVNATIEGMGILKTVVNNASQQLVMSSLNSVVADHLKKVAKIYGLTIPVRNFNKAFNMKQTADDGGMSVKDSISSTWGKQATDAIDQAVADVQSGRRIGDSSKILSGVKSAFVTSTLAGNVSVWIKQAASYPTAGSILDAGSLAKGLTDYVRTSSGKVWDEIDEHTSQHYIRRIGLSSQELGELNQSKGWQNRINKRLGKASPMNWIQSMDVATTAALWCATKEQVQKNGISPSDPTYWDEVTKLYDRVIEETQPMYDSLHRAEITKNNALKNIVMFQTQPIQNSGILRDGALEYRDAKKLYGKDSPQAKEAYKGFRKAVTSQMASHFTFTLMTLMAAAVLHRMNPYRDEDKELTPESVAKAFSLQFGENFFGAMVPVFGNYAISAMEKIFGSSYYDVLSDPTVDKINTTINNFAKLKNPSLENFGKVLTDVATYFGIPADNTVKLIQGTYYHVQDAKNGDLGSFEYGTERTLAQNGRRLYEAYTASDEDMIRKVREEFGDDEKADSALRSAIREAYDGGDISEEEAVRQLSEYTSDDEDKAYWTVDKWKDEDDEYGKYDRWIEAVESGKDIKTVLREYIDHGVSEKTLGSEITKGFKQRYIDSTPAERAALKGYLLNAYQLLGYDRQKKSKDIDKWLQED